MHRHAHARYVPVLSALFNSQHAALLLREQSPAPDYRLTTTSISECADVAVHRPPGVDRTTTSWKMIFSRLLHWSHHKQISKQVHLSSWHTSLVYLYLFYTVPVFGLLWSTQVSGLMHLMHITGFVVYGHYTLQNVRFNLWSLSFMFFIFVFSYLFPLD